MLVMLTDDRLLTALAVELTDAAAGAGEIRAREGHGAVLDDHHTTLVLADPKRDRS